MSNADPPRITIDPPLATWRLGEPSPPTRDGRAQLAPILDTLGLHDTAFDPKRPVIATGHQAWLWHPGIVAKDLAMATACQRLGAQPIHLVVDHITNAALAIDVPVRRGDSLAVEMLRLGGEDLAVGTASRPPLSRRALAEAIHRLGSDVEGEVAVDLDALLDTSPGFDQRKTLADSITAMQLHAVRTWCPGVFVLRTSQLAGLASFQALVERMLRDAPACVQAYNRAVDAVPAAGVAPLLVERDRVELPLWVIDASGALGRVFADLADSRPLLTGEDGTPLRPVETRGTAHLPLAPKALTLTAYMRSTLCDFFIHGTGGGVYEQVTERWWARWVGGMAGPAVGAHDGRDAHPTDAHPTNADPAGLAPLAVVSADVTLDFDVPVASQAELEKAVWLRHHLPHNIDRYAAASSLDPALVAEKRRLLDGDPADHSKPAKLAARRRLHAINRALADARPDLLADADAAVARANRGVANAACASRRDWCFQLYPPDQLAGLGQMVADSA